VNTATRTLTKEAKTPMADSHLPPDQPPDDTVSTVRPDAGGWISASCISFDEVPADEVGPADRLLLDDGMLATVIRVTQGVFWLPDSREHGVAIDWEQQDGTATGTLVRAADTIVQRVRDGVR
jgi:hypothetical protein